MPFFFNYLALIFNLKISFSVSLRVLRASVVN